MLLSAMFSVWDFYVTIDMSQDTLPVFCELLLPTDKIATHEWLSHPFIKNEVSQILTIFSMDAIGWHLTDLNQHADLGLGAWVPVLSIAAMKLMVACCTDVKHPHPLDGFFRFLRNKRASGTGVVSPNESRPCILRDLLGAGILYFTGNPVLAGFKGCVVLRNIYDVLTQPDCQKKKKNVQDLKAAIRGLKEATPQDIEDRSKEVHTQVALLVHGTSAEAAKVPESLGKRPRAEEDDAAQGGSKRKR